MFLSKNNVAAVLRLLPHQDLKKEIQNFCQNNQISAASIVSVVGSLEKLNIRLANSNQYLTKNEKFEILSLQGLISAEGIHLHMTVADERAQVFGGHLMDDNIIFTTCEIVFLIMPELEFAREVDNSTGYKELSIRKK